MFGGMPSPFAPRPMRNQFTGETMTLREAIVETAEHLEAVCDHPTTQTRMNNIAASPQPERAAMESWILQQVLQDRHGITLSMLKEACHVS